MPLPSVSAPSDRLPAVAALPVKMSAVLPVVVSDPIVLENEPTLNAALLTVPLVLADRALLAPSASVPAFTSVGPV